MNTKNLSKLMNSISIVGITIILTIASIDQFAHHDLPCPLCLLQRVGMLFIGIGFLMNLRFGPKPAHYAISIIASLYTAFVATRQVLLHIIPNSGTYGQSILGLHLYTWSLVISIIFIIWIAIQMLLIRDWKTATSKQSPPVGSWLKTNIAIVFILFFIVCGFNVVTSYLECGFHQCPDDPIAYLHLLS